MERIRRVCKRRAARGGCTAPTFRGEAGDPIAMHHPVLPTTIRYSCTYARPSRNFTSLFCSCLSLSLTSSLIAALCRFRLVRSRFVLRPRVFLRSGRITLFLASFSLPVTLYLLSLPRARLRSLSTIRALVFPRHNSTVAVAALFQHFTTHRRDSALCMSRNIQRHRYLICSSSCNLDSLEIYRNVGTMPSVER